MEVFLHCCLSTHSLSLNGTKKLDLDDSFSSLSHYIRPSLRTSFRILSPFLQLAFNFSSIWVSTSWTVSLAAFLNESSLELLPTFVWPNPAPPLQMWIIDNNHDNVSYSWATCNLRTSSFSSDTNETFMGNATAVNSTVTTFDSFFF